MIGDDIDRPGDRKRRNRRAAGECLQLHHTESVGEARKHKDIGRGQMRTQILALLLAEEDRIRIFLREQQSLRPVADDDLRSRQVERKKRFEILFDRNPAHGHEDRARQVDRGGALGREQFRVDAAGPEAELAKAALAQLLAQ